MDASVFQRRLERAVDELMLFDQRLSLEGSRTDGKVEMVHGSRAIEDADLGIGELGADQPLQRVVIDHDFSRAAEPALSASANRRASPNVSGKRVAPLANAAVTPLARMMPVTPRSTAGTPLARNGPTSIANDFCTRASPRKSARRVLARLFITLALYVASHGKAWRR